MNEQWCRKTQEFLKIMFQPKSYSADQASKQLDSYGGILCLLNNLKTSHNEGLYSHNPCDHEERMKIYGKNQQPAGQNMLKRSINQQRDFMINLLFYLLTLRICIKLLLKRDQYLFESSTYAHTYNSQEYLAIQLKIYDEIFSMILLIVMIFLRAMVNIEYYNINQDQRKYKNQFIKVKRDSEIQTIEEKNLMVGDIVILEVGKTVRVDGILLSCGGKNKNLMVSEAQTILQEDIKIKSSVWHRNTQNKDCFILAGSKILKGEGQIVVCTVGPNCSFRLLDKNFQLDGKKGNIQPSPLVLKVKKMIDLMELAAKFISIFLATWVSIKYLFVNEKIIYINNGGQFKLSFTWEDLLYILKIYTSFIGLICFLQRLKILRSLFFYIQMNSTDSNTSFRVFNFAALQQLSGIDIFFIESSAISLAKFDNRGVIEQRLNHQLQLSELNTYFDLKVITKDEKESILGMFDEDIKESCIYDPYYFGDEKNRYGIVSRDSRQVVFNSVSGDFEFTHRSKIQSLINSNFIVNSTTENLLEEYIPIFIALGYRVAVLTKQKTTSDVYIPRDILHISFSSLEDQQFPSSNSKSQMVVRNNQWVKIQNTIAMEEILLDLAKKSFVYARLFNVYSSLLINNVIVFVFFCWYSSTVKLISLYWSLTIIIVHRYLFFTVYRRIVLQNNNNAQTLITHTKCQISLRQALKLNIFLIPYYLMVISRLNQVSNFFFFFLFNSLFRIQTHLFKSSPTKSYKPLITYTVIFLILNLINIVKTLFTEDLNSSSFEFEISEEIRIFSYSTGLLVIFVCYVQFL